jgi:hypothetical protein
MGGRLCGIKQQETIQYLTLSNSENSKDIMFYLQTNIVIVTLDDTTSDMELLNALKSAFGIKSWNSLTLFDVPLSAKLLNPGLMYGLIVLHNEPRSYINSYYIDYDKKNN